MRRAVLAWAAALLVLAPAACGKQGNLVAPEGEEDAYTYPQSYPNPATVVPQAGTAQEPEARPRARDALDGAGDITVLPGSRRTTKTYGTPAP